jgi:hypothetical protein
LLQEQTDIPNNIHVCHRGPLCIGFFHNKPLIKYIVLVFANKYNVFIE